MIVRDLLVEALARANHCQRGFGADASEVVVAEKQFNAQLRKYSDDNLITAYQKIYDIESLTDEQKAKIENEGIVIGKPTYKKGVRITEGTLEKRPTAKAWRESGHIAGRDYYYDTENDKYYGCHPYPWTGTLSARNPWGEYSVTNSQAVKDSTQSSDTGWVFNGAQSFTIPETGTDYPILQIKSTVEEPSLITAITFIGHEESATTWCSGRLEITNVGWYEADREDIIETDVDVKVNDMSRIMSCMVKDQFGRWIHLNFCPLTNFYANPEKDVYTVSVDGENKLRFRMKPFYASGPIKFVYNGSMKFDKNQTLELPEAHIELLTLATTCAILMEDTDADQSMLQNYSNALTKLEQQIIASTSTQRRITRDSDPYHRRDRIAYLMSGEWILGG